MATEVNTITSKMRDDFSELELNDSNWEVVSLGAGMSIDMSAASALRIVAGTTANQETVIRSLKGYISPFRVMFAALAASLVTQRIANQEIELRVATKDGAEVAAWLLDGTVATTYKLRSGNGGVLAADTSVTARLDSNTGSAMLELETYPDEVYWHQRVSDSGNARSFSDVRNRRVPDPEKLLYVEIRVRNLATAPASSTVLNLDAVMVQDINELTTEVTGGRGGGSASQSIPVSVLGTIAVGALAPGTAAAQLGKAEDTAHATGDTGVLMLGVRAPAAPAAPTSAAGDYGYILLDAEGKVITTGTADPAVSLQAVVDATLTTDTAVFAAAPAGVRNYVTDVTFENTGAAAARVIIDDGATRIYSVTVPATSTFQKQFATPLKGTAATALNVKLGAAGTVTVSVQGYRGI